MNRAASGADESRARQPPKMGVAPPSRSLLSGQALLAAVPKAATVILNRPFTTVKGRALGRVRATARQR